MVPRREGRGRRPALEHHRRRGVALDAAHRPLENPHAGVLPGRVERAADGVARLLDLVEGLLLLLLLLLAVARLLVVRLLTLLLLDVVAVVLLVLVLVLLVELLVVLLLLLVLLLAMLLVLVLLVLCLGRPASRRGHRARGREGARAGTRLVVLGVVAVLRRHGGGGGRRW